MCTLVILKMSIEIYCKSQGKTLISGLTEGQPETFGPIMESEIGIGDFVIAFTTNDNKHTLVFSKIIDSPDVITYIKRSIISYITGTDRLLTEDDLLLMAEYIEDVTNTELFSTMLATNIKGRNRLERSHIYLW